MLRAAWRCQRRWVLSRGEYVRPDRAWHDAVLADSMVACAQALRCFSKIGVFTENIQAGFFRLSETTKIYQERRVVQR